MAAFKLLKKGSIHHNSWYDVPYVGLPNDDVINNKSVWVVMVSFSRIILAVVVR